jgi:Flp pilus assembly protein TadG
MLSFPAFLLRRVRANRRANVAIEFALIGPVMITLILGLYDVSKAMILYQEVYNSAHDSALAASIMAEQPDQTTALTVAQTQQAMSIYFAEMPWVRSGIENGTRSVTLSGITFQQNSSSCVPSSTNACATTAYVTWSIWYQWGDQRGSTAYRPCGAVTQVAASSVAAGSMTTIGTAGVQNPDPILVVDIHYQYTPMFTKFITGPIDFWVTAYWPVRSAASGTATYLQYTKFDPTNQLGGLAKCSGWS